MRGYADVFAQQSLAIEPLETNTIDLLNLALEVNAEMPPGNLGVIGLPGGDAAWRKVLMDKQAEATKGEEGSFGIEEGSAFAMSIRSRPNDSSAMELVE